MNTHTSLTAAIKDLLVKSTLAEGIKPLTTLEVQAALKSDYPLVKPDYRTIRSTLIRLRGEQKGDSVVNQARAVIQHAKDNYNKSGWDVIVECYTEAEVVEALTDEGTKTITKAIALFTRIAKGQAERRQEQLAEVF